MKKCILLLSVILIAFNINGAFADQPASTVKTLSLKDSISFALDKSPAMIAARDNAKAADARVGQAFGAVLPNLSLTGMYGNAGSQPSTFVIPAGALGPGTPASSMDVGTTETYVQSNYNLVLSQPLYTGGRLSGALDIAKFYMDVSNENLRKAEIDLKYNVINAYYGVLRTKKLYGLAQESLDMADSHRKQVKAMYSAGTATKADILRTEVQVANTELSLKKAANALALSKDAFNNVLGWDLESPVELSVKDFVLESVQPTPYKECVAMAFDTKPDWNIFQLNKKISDRTVGLMNANYFPSVSLVGTYGNKKVDYPEYPGNSDVNSWAISANGTWTLFDGFTTSSKVKEAEANLNSIKASEESARNAVILEVKDACLNLGSSIDEIASAKKAVDLADENYKISQEKYRSGIGSNLEMIDAQTALVEARTNLYQAQFDYQIDKAKVNQVLGKEIYSF
jgi:outer membrane protein TolC